ncbi:hypothetical protein Hanom_Chr14g01300021 [Helianthus anomalus]
MCVFNEEVIGVLVKNGSTIEEKIPIRWKNQSFDVWVSEINQFWTLEFIKEQDQDEEQYPGANDVTSQPVNMETEVIGEPAPIPAKPQMVNEKAENEQLDQEEQSEDVQSEDFDCNNDGTEESAAAIKEILIPSLEAINEEGSTAESQNKGDRMDSNSGPDKITAPKLENGPSVGVLGDPIISNTEGGPTKEAGGPDSIIQKKRKRVSLAEARVNSLKPQNSVGKNKIPDLNIELSDDSRIKVKRRLSLKKRRSSRRKNKGKNRAAEEEFSLFEGKGQSVDDELNSEWEEEDNPDLLGQHAFVSGNEENDVEIGEIEQVVGKETDETVKIGEMLGVDLSKHVSLVNKLVIEDQVDVRKQ